MSKITKPSAVNNYAVVSQSNTKPTNSKDSVQKIHVKSDVHNSPDHRSQNEYNLLDTFYENTYNLKASFNRVTTFNEESASSKHYFISNKREILLGATSMVEDINRLIHASIKIDHHMGTHFHFLMESILHTYEKALLKIGIAYDSVTLALDAHQFYEMLLECPADFKFIFEPVTGLIDRCVELDHKIQNVYHNNATEGQFLDLRA